MKRIFALILLLWASLSSAQEVKMFTWDEALNANPDSVFGITFEKMKLKSIPEDLQKFTKLRHLNLSKNKLTRIPQFIGELKDLRRLNVERNELDFFPIVVCRLDSLQELIINRNNISEIPDCIEYASNLEYIDVYDNPINRLPESLMRMERLKKIDFTGIRFSPEFQETWIGRLTGVELVFDSPCDCMN